MRFFFLTSRQTGYDPIYVRPRMITPRSSTNFPNVCGVWTGERIRARLRASFVSGVARGL